MKARYIGLECVSVFPEAPDEVLMEHAFQEDRVLITSDTDFGELAFVWKLPHGVIVRLVELNIDEQIRALGEMLQNHNAELIGPLIVTIGRGRIRFRKSR